MPQVTVKKWGNSPSVRLPVAIMEAASLKIDDVVDIRVEGGLIILEPVQVTEYRLEALLADITDDNIHEEVATGKPAGKEAL